MYNTVYIKLSIKYINNRLKRFLAYSGLFLAGAGLGFDIYLNNKYSSVPPQPLKSEFHLYLEYYDIQPPEDLEMLGNTPTSDKFPITYSEGDFSLRPPNPLQIYVSPAMMSNLAALGIYQPNNRVIIVWNNNSHPTGTECSSNNPKSDYIFIDMSKMIHRYIWPRYHNMEWNNTNIERFQREISLLLNNIFHHEERHLARCGLNESPNRAEKAAFLAERNAATYGPLFWVVINNPENLQQTMQDYDHVYGIERKKLTWPFSKTVKS